MRLGYGFARQRNGAVNMHAASCLAALTGAWQAKGGGALYGNAAIYPLDRTLIQGTDIAHDHLRVMDQSRIGEVLCGNADDLAGGPPVHSLFVQNTNPAVVAPDSNRVIAGLLRDDLFTIVHEQFMTETAALADLVLPATMFLEHDDLYTASGHTHLQIGRQVMPAPGECRSNHEVLQELAKRFALPHAGFAMSAWQIIDNVLAASNLPSAEKIYADGGIDLALKHQTANFLDGFGHADQRFHFSPIWAQVGPNASGMELVDGALVVLTNHRGDVCVPVVAFTGVQQGTVVVESLWPNASFAGGVGINALIGSDPGKPNGGAVYHDTAVAVRLAEPDLISVV